MRFLLSQLPEYLQALEQGATREAVAPVVGMTHGQLRAALAKGKEELDRYGPVMLESERFIEAGKGACGRLYMYTARAEARAELELSKRLFAAAGAGVWKAAQTLLERRFPERWALVKRTEARSIKANTTNQKPGLSPETAAQIRRRVLGIPVPSQEEDEDE